jgi:hypothetical protein
MLKYAAAEQFFEAPAGGRPLGQVAGGRKQSAR